MSSSRLVITDIIVVVVIVAVIGIPVVWMAARYWWARGGAEKAKVRFFSDQAHATADQAAIADEAIVSLIAEWEAAPASAGLVPEGVRNGIYAAHQAYTELEQQKGIAS